MSLPNDNVKEWCKVIAIDRKRKVRMHAEMRNPQGETIDLDETVESISSYVQDKMKDENLDANMVQQQIFPMMARASVATLADFVGPHTAGLMVAQELFRRALTHCMMSSFLLMQFIKKNDIKIFTTEESVSDEEIASYDRVNKASSLASLAAELGTNPRDVIREMVKQGQLKAEDLEALGAEDLADDIESPEQN